MKDHWAGPFLGEFGWECMMWAPWLRKLSHIRSIVVVCEEGKEALYRDLATEIHTIPRVEGLRRDCQNAFRLQGGKLGPRDYGNLANGVAGENVQTITPFEMPVEWKMGKTPFVPDAKWHSMRDRSTDFPETIGIHARMSKQSPDRNWSRSKWDELMERVPLGYRVDVFGLSAEAYIPKPGNSQMGVSQDYNIATIARRMSDCKVIVGPSSGPLHLANLCEVSVVWWSPNGKDLHRYKTAWNPFGCENRQVVRSWNPTVDQVLKCLDF